ncbi:MAG: hypothetical protein JWL77_1414 [Chthonomonadaceae bacterium]|nr:hypothetical protein [Chthonomonadaceae bacterium]
MNILSSGLVNDIIIGLIIGIVMCFGFYFYGSRRDVNEAVTTRPDDLTSFTTSTPKADVVKMILLFAQKSRLKVERLDEPKGEIILGENMNLLKNHNGFWLPIYLSENVSGMTTVEIGIQSKVSQARFMLRAIRDKTAQKIKVSIEMQGNRSV